MSETDETRDTLNVLRNNTVIDCDVHHSTSHPVEEIGKRVSEPYRSILLEAEDPGKLYPSHGRNATAHVDKDSRISTADDGDQLQTEHCDTFEVDVPIINPIGQENVIQDRDRAFQETRAKNDWIMEEFLDDHQDNYATIYVTPREPAKSCEEIERLADEDQFVGVEMISTGNRTPLGDPKYDRIYQTAEDNGLPIVYHSLVGVNSAIEFPVLTWDFQKWVSQHTLAHSQSAMNTITSLIVQGVPVKFPNLEFVIVESGIEFIPWLMFRLNREIDQRPSQAPLLERTPEEYIRDRFYFGTQPMGDPVNFRHLQQIYDIVGADSIVFATDFPHFDFDAAEMISRCLDVFSAEEKEKVLYKNAANVFGIDA
jgi:predicted TIM-barrel fold metal-dependent hydrolase